MDPSQTAHDPVRQVKPSTLIRSLKPVPADESAAARENRKNAAAQLASISALKNSSDFQWYEREFIDKPFRAASEKIRGVSPRDPEESLEMVHTAYRELRKVKVGMIEREISHRRQLDPNDEEIVRLQELLNAL